MAILGELAPLDHGGDLGAARKLFPGAPEPFLDLSAGINPNPYPLPELSDAIYARLPEQATLLELKEMASSAYGAPSPAHVAIAPGSQILVAQLGFLLARGRAAVFAPTYALPSWSIPTIRTDGSWPKTCCSRLPIGFGAEADFF